MSEELLARVEQIRTRSALSSEYWRLQDQDGVVRYVYLCPPGDLARVRQHYPGARAVQMSKREWVAVLDKKYSEAI